MLKNLLFSLAFLFIMPLLNAQEKIALITNDRLPGKETQAVMDFLQKEMKMKPVLIPFKDLDKKNALKDYHVAWLHMLQPESLNKPENLRNWVSNGGKLLLTMQAMKLVAPVCGEDRMPSDSLKEVHDDGFGRRLGLHAFLDHAVFKGMNGGAYLLRPVKDTSLTICGYFDKKALKGKVIAVDWDYIFLREQSKLMLEYAQLNGRVIAIGGYINFSLPNYNERHLSLFMNNVLNYLTCDSCFHGNFWNYTPASISECPEIYLPDILVTKPAPSAKWNPEDDALTMKNQFATENFWDVAGERLLTMGIETSGIEEVWAHPFMAFRDYEVGIRFSYKDTTYWLKDERPEIEVHPGYFARTYKFARAYLKEIIVNDPVHSAGVVHYEYDGVYDAELTIRFHSNLRLMWPYSEDATGSLCWFWNPDQEAWLIKNETGTSAMMLGANRSPSEHSAARSPRGDVAAELKYQIKMNDRMDVVYTASAGDEDIFMLQRDILADPEKIFTNANDHANNLLNNSTLITTPDQNFNKGYRWALIGTDRFFVNTPGMGKSLVAGYSTTRSGWDGGHKINGRPGYGWYFGRDGEWSGFALLDYGDFEKVKQMLLFYQKYQDLSGKIFHEATTSGIIHYDAADATPLYIVLWGKYFRHTGDTAFLRESWPHIKKALDFCFSTDTDRDHLIENTNVGHGWVEGGELYGSHETIYMAGAWHAALNEAFNMSSALKDPESDSYHVEANQVNEVINEKFFDKKSHRIAYGINKDGGLRTEPTILPAVPVYFRVFEQELSSNILYQYGSNAFTTNWGVRILREDSPLFKPQGYHYGSVWPLFTGWASLAEYSNGNGIRGFSHLMNNLNIYKNWGLGFTEEVLNGAVYKPSGVCPHQCWSETMVLQPALEGMLGFNANAAENKINLSPAIPADWDSLSVRNLRMAENRVSFKMERKDGKYIYKFNLSGKNIKIGFSPLLPSGTRITSAKINGKTLNIATVSLPKGLLISSEFSINGETIIEFGYEGGISALPVVEDPRPDDPAEGLRIVDYGLDNKNYYISLEAPSGSSYEIAVYNNTGELAAISDASLISTEDKILKLKVIFDRSDKKYTTKKITLTLK